MDAPCVETALQEGSKKVLLAPSQTCGKSGGRGGRGAGVYACTACKAAILERVCDRAIDTRVCKWMGKEVPRQAGTSLNSPSFLVLLRLPNEDPTCRALAWACGWRSLVCAIRRDRQSGLEHLPTRPAVNRGWSWNVRLKGPGQTPWRPGWLTSRCRASSEQCH